MDKKIILLLAILFMTVPAYAQDINGTITRADRGTGLQGVIVANGSNTSTTNASGWYNITGMVTSDIGFVLTVTPANDSYTSTTKITSALAGNGASGQNVAVAVSAPSLTSVAAGGITRTAATVSWTSNKTTVANRLIYSMDSGLTNNLFTSDWSNNTASPSISLSGLRLNTRYYVQVESYNLANSTEKYTTSTTNFITQKGNYSEEDEPVSYELVVTAQNPGEQSSPLASMVPVQSRTTDSQEKKIIAFAVILLLVYIIFSSGKKKK